MNHLCLTVESIWEDHDSMLEIRVTLAGRGYQAWQEAYVYPEEIVEFADKLQNFPKSVEDQVILERGSVDSGVSGWLKLRAYVTDGSGHCALEFAANTNGNALTASKFQFSMPIEAAALNELGRLLAPWATSTDEPFCFESNAS